MGRMSGGSSSRPSRRRAAACGPSRPRARSRSSSPRKGSARTARGGPLPPRRERPASVTARISEISDVSGRDDVGGKVQESFVPVRVCFASGRTRIRSQYVIRMRRHFPHRGRVSAGLGPAPANARRVPVQEPEPVGTPLAQAQMWTPSLPQVAGRAPT
jgi:hypothetical protein